MIARYAALAALVLLPASSAAQTISTVPLGARVRVHPAVRTAARPSRLHGSQPVVGTIAERRADTLVISLGPHGAVALFPDGSIGQLELSQGIPPRLDGAVRGIWRGLRFGLAIAPIASLAASSDRRRFDHQPIAISLGLSALTGAVVGALAPEERWVQVAR
jgi:hypothetical protein